MKTFRLTDAENGREMRLGDNCVLHTADGYFSANDEGEWKPLLCEILEVEEPEEPTDPTPPPSGTHVTPATLAANIAPGATLVLASGDYGAMPALADDMTLSAEVQYGPRFTSGTINNRDVELMGLFFDLTPTKNDEALFRVEGDGSKVTLCKFQGVANSGGAYIGRGIRVRASNVTLSGNDISNFWKAITFGKDFRNNVVRGNMIHHNRSDGIGVGYFEDMLIEDNILRDFGGAAVASDHRDAIQFQGGGRNLTVRDNLIDQGTGYHTQSIFGGPGLDGDVIIEGNVIYNSHSHAISVTLLGNGAVQKNSVFPIPRPDANSPGAAVPKINIKGPNPLVKDNITAGLVPQNATLEGNEVIPLPFDANEIVKHKSVEAGDSHNEFRIKAGSRLDGKGAPSVAVA